MNPPSSPAYDVIIIGGGPAGSTLGRLLARWGHRVLLLARAVDRSRGLAESIPPSARKLLAASGVLDAVEQAAFPANRGNLVWWGDTASRLEDFESDQGSGWLVFRPDLDQLLLAGAASAGVDVRIGVTASPVRITDTPSAIVEYGTAAARCRATGRFVADCSGRAGILARKGLRMPEPHHRLQAYLGRWRAAGAERQPIWTAHEHRTIVETYETGWAWSLAISPTVRQVAVMVDRATIGTTRTTSIRDAYDAELAKTEHLASLIAGATLEHVWASDASMYSASRFAGPGFALVGDAGCCIDPLSSFGVKKALGSAWLAAVALHTALVDRARCDVALDFFSRREREVYAAELARTREYARLAHARHGGPFWANRSCDQPSPAVLDVEAALLRSPRVAAAHHALRQTRSAALCPGSNLRWSREPVIRGHEIILEDAIQLGHRPLRFAAGVDLTALVGATTWPRSVANAYDAYCQVSGTVPLPQFLAAVSLLLSEGVLALRRAAEPA